MDNGKHELTTGEIGVMQTQYDGRCYGADCENEWKKGDQIYFVKGFKGYYCSIACAQSKIPVARYPLAGQEAPTNNTPVKNNDAAVKMYCPYCGERLD